MVPFQQEYVVMVVTAFLILAGDTGFVSGLFALETLVAEQCRSQSCMSFRCCGIYLTIPATICSLRCLMYVQSRV